VQCVLASPHAKSVLGLQSTCIEATIRLANVISTLKKERYN